MKLKAERLTISLRFPMIGLMAFPPIGIWMLFQLTKSINAPNDFAFRRRLILMERMGRNAVIIALIIYTCLAFFLFTYGHHFSAPIGSFY